MDGFEANEGIILIAATNRPDVLDPALLRPGRFDRQVVVPRPDIIGREKILKVHVRKVPLAPDVDLRVIARGTPGFSGADLANLVNEAALLAARRSKRLVTQHEFEDAKDKVMMGAERRSMVMNEEEKTLTAYHEGGHALVALHMPASDPVHKATIIPRGRALGMVMRLPERDMLSYTRAKLKADITVAMGGRVAEEIVFGYEKVTSGAVIRHQDGDAAGARHGHAIRHVRQARPARLRRQRGRGVPRPFHRADAEPVRRDPDHRRRGDPPHRRRDRTRRRARSSPRISTICTRSRAACSNTRRCRARRSRICSRASRRCASSPPRSRPGRDLPPPFRPPDAASGRPSPSRIPAASRLSRRPEARLRCDASTGVSWR